MTSVASSELSSAAATLQLQVPTEYQRPSEFPSDRNEPEVQILVTVRGYEEVDWKRLNGFEVPHDDTYQSSEIYKKHDGVVEGWRVLKIRTGEHHWLCRRCHLAKRLNKNSKPYTYKAHATSGALEHLKKVHNVDKFGKTIPKPAKTSELDWQRNGNTEASANKNVIATSFSSDEFKSKLYTWLISDGVAFNQLQSTEFRELLTYLNPRCARWIPDRTTASRTVDHIHDQSIGLIMNQLETALTRINISFDLWTSGNKLALLGICAHFIDQEGTPVTTLLSLPEQQGRHTGKNMAETIAEIITTYDIQGKLGWFTTDNAASNGTCLDALGIEFGFVRHDQWVRCCGHIFNLVGQAALMGHDDDAFSANVEGVELEEQLLILWRRKGPIGKLHNVVHWINRSPQRVERFKAHQRALIAPVRPDKKKETYDLIEDVTTRWNSFHLSADRALYLQPAIDATMDEERASYDAKVARAERSLRATRPKCPHILDDLLSAADWQVLAQYLAILKPVKEATMLLQGHVGGKFGAMWQVLPTFDKLLTHFENQVAEYPIRTELQALDIHSDGFAELTGAITSFLDGVGERNTTAEDHFAINIKLAWAKLDEYYSKLDNTPIYVAAIVLHPCFKWRWLEKEWKNRPDWLADARIKFTALVARYRDFKPKGVHPHPPAKRRRVETIDPKVAEVYLNWPSSEDEDEPLDIDMQLAYYRRCSYYRYLSMNEESSPIQYWLDKRSMWPQLAALALDIYAIPVMSDEPERVFSIAGATVHPRRRSLAEGTINSLLVVRAWVGAKLIDLSESWFTRSAK